MDITTETYGNRTEVCDGVSGEYLGYVHHNELSGTYGAAGNTFDLLADAIEHIANILPNRVRAGALIMDSVKPGWADLIDVDKLCMERVDDCIVGQAFKVYDPDFTTQWGNWNNALEALGSGADRGAGNGFNDEESRYDILKDLWVNEISKRKS